MKRHIITGILALLVFWNSESSAFWGNDSTDPVSGLNVTGGYDINTTATLTGSVVSPPERKGQEQHAVMSVTSSQGTVTAVLGPWWYWEKQTVVFLKNQEVTITGSLAQGKDGARYVFVQRLENRSSGETVLLRSESGKPLWSGAGSGGQNGMRQYNGNGPRSAAGSRGSGMRGGRR